MFGEESRRGWRPAAAVNGASGKDMFVHRDRFPADCFLPAPRTGIA